MARTVSSNTDNWSASTACFSAAPGSQGLWVKPSALGQFKLAMQQDDGTANNAYLLALDPTTTSNDVTGGQVEAANPTYVRSSAATSGAWQLIGANYASTVSRAVFSANTLVANSTNVVGPTGIVDTFIGGRVSGRALLGEYASAFAWNRVLAAIEWLFLAAGGNPRYLSPAHYWYLNTASGTESDLIGSINLTISSTTAAADAPSVAPYWTATAQGSQSATQGGTFPAITLTSKFDQPAGSVDYTCTLLQVSTTGGTPTTANGAGTASNQLTVAAIGSIVAGNYVTVGANPLTLVLYVSGSTLVLASSLSWSNAATVTPYSASAPTGLTSNGYTITSGVTGGTVGAGAVGTYNNLLYRATNNSVSSAFSDSALFTMTVASSSTTPSFSAGPTLNSTNTDGWAFNATSNQTATWWQGVYLRGSATPSAANIIAGAGTGFVSQFSTSLTASVAGTNTSTGLTNPIYDVYHVLTNGSGNSSIVSFTALMKAPPTGKQYTVAKLNTISSITQSNPVSITTAGSHGYTTGYWLEVYGVSGMTQINGAFLKCTVTGANTLTLPIDSTSFGAYTSGGNITWGQSDAFGASTTVVTGDVFVTDATDAQGAPITVMQEGVTAFTIPGSGRQNYAVDCYSVSLGSFIGQATSYENDQPPQPTSSLGSVPALFFPTNQSNTQSIAQFFSDPQGDTLTISTAGSLPPGMSLLSPNLTVLTSTPVATSITFTATNYSGESVSSVINVIVGNVPVPNAVGLNQSAAQALATGSYFNTQFGSGPDPNPAGPAPAGTVINQNPAANTFAAPLSTIVFTVSNGTSSGTPPPTPPPLLAYANLILARAAAGDTSPSVGARLNEEWSSTDVCQTTAADLSGTVYLFPDIPSNARVLDVQLMNTANAATNGTSYKVGVFNLLTSTPVVSGADSIFAPIGLQMDTARNTWTSIYNPSIAGESPSIADVNLSVWQLLGLSSPPTPQAQYSIGITAVNPGSAGGLMALRIRYTL